MAKVFMLELLIKSNNKQVSKTGMGMGALILIRVTDLELADVVEDDYCMEKINQAMLKYLINSNKKLLTHFDDSIEDLHDRCSEIEKKQGQINANKI